jgi:hypothetical protein
MAAGPALINKQFVRRSLYFVFCSFEDHEKDYKTTNKFSELSTSLKVATNTIQIIQPPCGAGDSIKPGA